MTLTEQKKQKFVDWLENKTAINFKCAICTSDDWAVLDEVVYLEANPGTFLATRYPNVALICQCCKHTVLFNATESGVMDYD